MVCIRGATCAAGIERNNRPSRFGEWLSGFRCLLAFIVSADAGYWVAMVSAEAGESTSAFRDAALVCIEMGLASGNVSAEATSSFDGGASRSMAFRWGWKYA
ncbi:hypothetical protein GCM10027341_01270 [Spirosoma knui]